jgi:NAD-dependent deacetylase
MRLGDLAPDGAQLRPHIVWFEEPVPAFSEAILLAEKADIFIVVGTSLLVYPAAGLIEYIPPFIPRYLIDRKIPSGAESLNVIPIEQPATIGVPECIRRMRAN